MLETVSALAGLVWLSERKHMAKFLIFHVNYSSTCTGCGKKVSPKIFLQFFQQLRGISKRNFTDIFSILYPRNSLISI